MSQENAIATQLTTIRDYLRWGMTQFTEAKLWFGQGTDNAWDEALALVRYALHLPVDIGPKVLDATLTTDERHKVIALFEQRIKERKPAAYLTNTAYFMEMPFYVDERVIIPRSPIAELLTNGLQPWFEREPESILDLCTGSGCIAIGAAHVFPNARVVASDINKDALAVAQKNIDQHKADVELIESDLFKNIEPQKFDIIISNPPYVSDEEIDGCTKEYHHEPRVAFAGGDDDGLLLVDHILSQANHYLNKNGLLIVEVGTNWEAAHNRFPNLPFIWPDFENGGEGVFILAAGDLKRV